MPRAGARLAALVAATLLGVAGAYAQTLTNPDPKSVPPSVTSEKSHAQEHAKACPAFGAGFVQLPGTDACVKIGASVTTDVTGTGN
jgi:Porin subfamily